MLTIKQRSNDAFDVTVEGPQRTTHQVTLTDADHERLGSGSTPKQDVIRESFRFLLEREPNTSILPRFELPLIARYFPEYEAELRRRLDAGAGS